MKKRVMFFLAVFSIFFINLFLVSAGFTLGNKSSSIETSYSPNEKIAGWINISLDKEPGSSVINTNFGGSTSLIDFLEDNGAEYSCIPSSCENDYSLSNGQARKDFSLNFSQKRFFAINLTGVVFSVSDFSFKFNISNSPSCVSPVEVGLFDDEIKWTSWKFTNDFPCTYERGMGCFNHSSNSIEVNITTRQFCEKIKLLPSDKFKIGAWVRKVGVSAGLKMEIFAFGGGNALASCQLSDASTGGEEKECIIYYNNTQITDYYVCIRSNVSGAYTTKMESVGTCGFYAISGNSADSGIEPGDEQPQFDYYIFAKGASFSEVGEVNYNQGEYEKSEEGELAGKVMDYLREKYADNCESCTVNCTQGCPVPISVNAYSSMKVKISDLFASFVTYSDVVSSSIYDSSKVSSKISSGFLKLDLEYAEMVIPSLYGNQTVNLLLGGQTLVSKSISISKIPVIRNVVPRVIPAGVEGLLIADVYSPANKTIVRYTWDFGDGYEEETFVNSASHVYPDVDLYILNLEVEDSDGLIASREFDIISGNPKDVVNSTLKKYRTRVNNVTSQIEAETGWTKKILEDKTGIEDINSKLTNLERKASLAESDEDYLNIMSNLSEMNVPVSLKKSSTANFPILVDTEAINLDYLSQYDESYSGNSSDGSDAFKNAILKWYSENVDASADYYTVSAEYDDNVETIFTYYKLKITALNPEDEEAYLIINGDVKVNPMETAKEFGDSAGIKFYKFEDKDIEFVAFDFENPFLLQVYIAPEVRKLDTNIAVGVCNSNKKCESERGETWKNCRNDCKPWGWAVFYIVLVLFLALLSYIGLQEWYKRKYETYLFGNRNDLFNILNFVNNSLARKMSYEDISKNLKKAGWSSEQIAYAVKKVKGRKTGMPFELGIPKFGELKKLKQEQNRKMMPDGKPSVK